MHARTTHAQTHAQVHRCDDVSGAQLRPAGLQLIWLPYTEDIRRMRESFDKIGIKKVECAAASVDVMKEAIDAMRIPAEKLTQIGNPVLQKHYAQLQALALDQEQHARMHARTRARAHAHTHARTHARTARAGRG